MITYRETIERSKPGLRRIMAGLGFLLIAHFAFVAFRVSLNHTPWDIFWISHAGTLLGGLGMVRNNRKLVSISLVAVFEPHCLWCIDLLMWSVAGHFPIGIVAYLENGSGLDWLQSANHIFTVPFLMTAAWSAGGVERGAWRWTGALFALLLLAGFLSPAASNVNCAHGLWPGLDHILPGFIGRLPSGLYLVTLVAASIAGSYIPVNWLLSKVMGAGCSTGATQGDFPSVTWSRHVG